MFFLPIKDINKSALTAKLKRKWKIFFFADFCYEQLVSRDYVNQELALDRVDRIKRFNLILQ